MSDASVPVSVLLMVLGPVGTVNAAAVGALWRRYVELGKTVDERVAKAVAASDAAWSKRLEAVEEELARIRDAWRDDIKTHGAAQLAALQALRGLRPPSSRPRATEPSFSGIEENTGVLHAALPQVSAEVERLAREELARQAREKDTPPELLASRKQDP